MLLYQRINIPQWSLIQETFSYLELPNTKVENCVFPLNPTEIAKLSKLLPIIPERKIKFAAMFGQKPHAVQITHIDGYSTSRVGASNTALNIPIKSIGQMTWYSGDYHLEEQADSSSKIKYLNLNWLSEPSIKDIAVIDSPTIVRINVPHRVINLHNEPRIVISIRYSPDIFLG